MKPIIQPPSSSVDTNSSVFTFSWENLFKTIAVFGFGLVLYWQIYTEIQFTTAVAQFKSHLTWWNSLLLIAAVALMPLNWALETIKWQKLNHKIAPISFSLAYKAVWSGVTFSLFTPNRIGEYGGRVFYIKPTHRLKTIVATVVTSLSQMAALFTGGSIALIVFLHLNQSALGVSNGILALTGGGCTIGMIFFYRLFFNINRIPKIFERFPRLNKYLAPFRFIELYNAKELLYTLAYSQARYLVYTLQYILVAYFFGIDASFVQITASVGVIFFLQTGIPLPPATGLLARSGIALFIWHFTTSDDLAIIASTFSLWLLNVLLPGAIGLFFIMKKH